MRNPSDREDNRRKFLQYLAASPLAGLSASTLAAAESGDPILAGAPLSSTSQRAPDPMVWKPYDPTYLIKSPQDALDVFEFEPVAHKNVPAAHFGYLASGADDEGSLRANRADYSKFVIRARRLRDVRTVDTSIAFLDKKWATPFFLCPIGSQRMFHRDAELVAARAAGKRGIMQALSNYASTTFNDVRIARGGSPLIFQLYPQPNFEITKAVVQRAEREGAIAILVTCDNASTRKTLTFERAKRDDDRICASCHSVNPDRPKEILRGTRRRPQFSEINDLIWDSKYIATPVTWDFLKRLREVTTLPIIPKGIMSAEDAALCVEHGLDGVYISNHGGRAEDTSGSTISVLPDVVAAVQGKIPVLIDGGARRGMDIVKALAMGATAVGVGRPYIWGLAAFGEPGVDRVLDILTTEVVTAMQQVGASRIGELNQGMIHRAL